MYKVSLHDDTINAPTRISTMLLMMNLPSLPKRQRRRPQQHQQHGSTIHSVMLLTCYFYLIMMSTLIQSVFATTSDVPTIPAATTSTTTTTTAPSSLDNSINIKADSNSNDDDIQEEEKPWFMRPWIDMMVGPVHVSLSLVTILTMFMVALQLVQHFWTRPSWAEASHILIRDHTQATKKLLTDLKTKTIQNDAAMFAKMAQEWSVCPSKENGGFLGKFRPGDMARNFNQCVFDPETPVQQTVGPIETSFGWHLIYIHQRHLSQQVLATND
jgi:parvulin-like peptidyl-prolyl isomerase